MTSPRVECIEFYFVDPRLVSTDDLTRGIVAIVGALFQGSFTADIMPLDTPDEMAQALNERVIYLAHFKHDVAILVDQGAGGIMQFHYCSICGGNLTSTGCMRCGTTYATPSAPLGGRVPTLLPCVTAYVVTAVGHTFRQPPPLV